MCKYDTSIDRIMLNNLLAKNTGNVIPKFLQDVIERAKAYEKATGEILMDIPISRKEANLIKKYFNISHN